MPVAPIPLTATDAVALLEALLAHGWGELRIVVYDHHIKVIFHEWSIMTPQQLDTVRQVCYGKNT